MEESGYVLFGSYRCPDILTSRCPHTSSTVQSNHFPKLHSIDLLEQIP